MATPPRYRLDIEGLRAIAILSVIAFHAGIPGWQGGFVGVDVFFALSGFLITGLLFDEHQAKGRIDLPRFYARRARRLLPASALCCLVTAGLVAALASPAQQSQMATAFLGTALYASNFVFILQAGDYLAAELDTNPFLHTWSLSVEEQFYFVWPMLCLLAFRSSRRIALGVFGAVTAASFVACWLVTLADGALAFFLSPVRAWEFSAGAWAALWAKERQGSPPGIEWWGALGLALILTSVFTFDETTPFPGPAATVPVLGTLLMLWAGTAAYDNRVSRALHARPLQWFGKLSYSWYLWHWPALVVTDLLVPHAPFGLRLLSCVLALVPAWASFRFVENPLRHSAWLKPNARSLAFGLALTSAATAVAMAWKLQIPAWTQHPSQRAWTQAADERPDIYAGCHVPTRATESKLAACTFGRGPTRIALYGDSHAAHWFPSLQHDDVELLSLTKSACAPLALPQFNAKLGRAYDECAAWQAHAVAMMHAFAPDVVVVSLREDNKDWTSDQWARGVTDMVDALPRDVPVVLLLDVRGGPQDVTACAAQATWRGGMPRPTCDYEPRAAGGFRQAASHLATERAHVVAVDPDPWLCPSGPPCAPMENDVPVWRDHHHISVPFAKLIGPTLRGALPSK